MPLKQNHQFKADPFQKSNNCFLGIVREFRNHIQRIKSNELSQPILFVSDKCLDNHHMENYSAALKALSKNNDCYPCSHKYELAML